MKDIGAIVRDAVCEVLEDQAVAFVREQHVLTTGNAERRKIIEFVADVVAFRVKTHLDAPPIAASGEMVEIDIKTHGCFPRCGIGICATPATVKVKAWVFGEWAAHGFLHDNNRVSAKFWSVTHVPTGIRIPYSDTDCEDRAIRVARELSESVAPGKITSQRPTYETSVQIVAVLNRIFGTSYQVERP